MVLYITTDYLHEEYRSEGGVPYVFFILKDPNPYLLKEIQDSKKTAETPND